jgi:chemotaxis methyl-accepting protein methylase
MIYFEYHDVLHDNTFPEVDIVVVRDFLSFLGAEERDTLLSAIRSKLTDSGIVFVGDHEYLGEDDWESVTSRGVRCYRKK